jgi:hypothetical protein
VIFFFLLLRLRVSCRIFHILFYFILFLFCCEYAASRRIAPAQAACLLLLRLRVSCRIFHILFYFVFILLRVRCGRPAFSCCDYACPVGYFVFFCDFFFILLRVRVSCRICQYLELELDILVPSYISASVRVSCRRQ